MTEKVSYNAENGRHRTKRVRTIFTPEQLERLEHEFQRQQYMVGPERLYLASTLQLTEAQVTLDGGMILEGMRDKFPRFSAGEGVVPEPANQVEKAATGDAASQTGCLQEAPRRIR